LISLLSPKDSFPPLAAAFDKKHVNVAWMDLINSQYHNLLSSSYTKLDISKSFDKMIEMGEKDKQLLVLYTTSSSKKRLINSLKEKSLTGISTKLIVYLVGAASHLSSMTWLISLTR
jgi:hypothetical protein